MYGTCERFTWAVQEVNKQHRSNSRHLMSDQPDRHKSIPFEHAHSDQCRHDWAVDLTQESPRLSGKRNSIRLASATTNWETHLFVQLHSRRSAAWKPGQNHDYQLHSSPNPVRRKREKTTALTNRKRAHYNIQTHTLSDLCQWKFDHFKLANQTEIYPQSCHTEEDKPPRRWSTEAWMGREDRLMMNKQSHMCYRRQRVRTTPKAASWGVYVRTCVREDKCECTCCWRKQRCESAHLHVILLASLWLLANSLCWACFTSTRLWRCVHGCNMPEPECEADFTELSGCRLSSLWACIKGGGGEDAYLHPYHLAVK